RKNYSAPSDPYGLELEWARATDQELVSRLADARFPVRDKAILELSKRGSGAVQALGEGLTNDDPDLRLQCVWALNRIDHPQARSLVRHAISDPNEPIRLAAIHSAGLRYDLKAASMLSEALASNEPLVRRKAATALGRLKQPATVTPLLECIALGTDRFLDHAIIYALIQIGDEKAILPGLQSDTPGVRRAALGARDQLESPLLDRGAVVQLIDSYDDSLRNAALQVLQRHSDWANEIV